MAKSGTSSLSGKKLAVIGAGKMGGILIEAFVKNNLVRPVDISATVHRKGSERNMLAKHGIRAGTDNRAAAKSADVILLCLKPQTLSKVLDEIQPEMNDKKVVISIVASVPTETIERRLGGNVAVLRAMPNTPSMVGEGMTAVCKGRHATEDQLALAQKLFDAVGKTVVTEEKHMDAVTGLSGSGPAFIYIILEALSEGGVKMGLPREMATLLAAQTALGAAKVTLETGNHPALLKDMVTTPAGCTIDGILELEEGKLRVTLIKAVVKASQRAKELQFTE
ncbi:MAG TPA: pyrroline-5-carboxylate reductase [Candidatus Acidoferrum sp.]|nr:pyrroline-5-carboxylate reductase [Candidatus Acidoferrum sp.]